MKIFCDGFTIGANPSRIGGGYVVMNERQDLLAMHEIRHKYFTNNEGELLGILKATELAAEGDTIITDSKIAYWWVRKCEVRARPDLRHLAQMAKHNINTKKLRLFQEPRENNLAGNYIEFTLQK